MRFKFSKDFDYPIPGVRAFLAYKAGDELTIPKPHIDAALAAGAGKIVDTPSRVKVPDPDAD